MPDCCRIDARAAEIVLKADPRRRYLGYARERPLRQVGDAERWIRLAADEIERIATHHLAERDVAAMRVGIERCHDAQWPAPRHLARSGPDCLERFADRGGRVHLDLEA